LLVATALMHLYDVLSACSGALRGRAVLCFCVDVYHAMYLWVGFWSLQCVLLIEFRALGVSGS
jgi:hypothetical protein